jgi:hypothetical protein
MGVTVATATFEERAFRFLSHDTTMRNEAMVATIPITMPTLAVEVLLPDEVLADVCEGADAVDDGEFISRHEASVESATFNKADVPLCLPCESVMKNMRLVPSLTSTTQV